MHWGVRTFDDWHNRPVQSTVPKRSLLPPSHTKLALDESDLVREATINAKHGYYPPQDGDSKRFDLRTATDVGLSIKISDLVAFAKLPLAVRRAAMWGDKCAECKDVFDTDPETAGYSLVLCTSCREYRYCSLTCRGKHMYHSFEGCHIKPAFRVSDQHRIRHVLTADIAALESSLKAGTSQMNLQDQNPTLRLADHEAMLLLELAAYTGDVRVVTTLVNKTKQTPLSLTPGRTLCACIALDFHNIDAFVAIFVKETGQFGMPGCYPEINTIPPHLGMRILGILIEATKYQNFAGALAIVKEAKKQSDAVRLSRAFHEGQVALFPEPPESNDAFFSQRRQIISLFWVLLQKGIKFDTRISPVWMRFVSQALKLWVNYRSVVSIAPSTLLHLLKCDADNPKMMEPELLRDLLTHGDPELLEACLASGFRLPTDIDANLPTLALPTGGIRRYKHSHMLAPFLPVLSKHISADGWAPGFIPTSPLPQPKRDERGHTIMIRTWDDYELYDARDDTPDSIQWLASQGAEFDEVSLRSWAEDTSKIHRVIKCNPVSGFFIDEHWLAGFDALDTGFQAYLNLTKKALFDVVTCLPPDIINHVILKYLVQGEFVTMCSVIRAQLQAEVTEKNKSRATGLAIAVMMTLDP